MNLPIWIRPKAITAQTFFLETKAETANAAIWNLSVRQRHWAIVPPSSGEADFLSDKNMNVSEQKRLSREAEELFGAYIDQINLI